MTKIEEKSLSEKIIEAVIIGDTKQLSTLISKSKNITSRIEYTKALWHASENGHVECVKLLIPISSPKDNSDYALYLSSKNGHAECVKILIPVSRPMANNSIALQSAANNGHTECVKLLTSSSDKKVCQVSSLYLSAYNNHQECVKLLLPYSNISKWGEETWKGVSFEMQNTIRSYFSKISLEQNVLPGNNQNSKTKKSRKI